MPRCIFLFIYAVLSSLSILHFWLLFLIKFEKISASISLNIFFLHLSFFFSWDSNFMNVILVDAVILAIEPLFIFFSQLSRCSSVWIISVDFFSCLLIISPLLCNLLLITCSEFLISNFFSVLHFFFVSSLQSYSFSEIFYYLTNFTNIFL